MPETVSDDTELTVQPEMSAIGYGIAFMSAMALLPVLPIIAAVKLIDWARSPKPKDLSSEIDYEESAADPPEATT